MATEITDHDQNASPSVHDDGTGNNGALSAGDANRGTKRQRAAADDDDDDDDKPGRERRKIEIKFIQDKSRRHITFSKRKAGIMKKVSQPFPPQSPSYALYLCANPTHVYPRRVKNMASPLANAFPFARPTNSPSSPAPRCCCSSSPKPVSSTPSPRRSCSP